MDNLPLGIISSLSDIIELDGGAVAAILLSPDRRYLLQHRDNDPRIWDAGRWGLFGGSIDKGETPAQALARELAEELELRPATPFRYFTQIAWDYRPWSHGIKLRHYFEVLTTNSEIEQTVLHEGQEARLFSAEEVLHEPALTAYDSHALRMHINGPGLPQ